MTKPAGTLQTIVRSPPRVRVSDAGRRQQVLRLTVPGLARPGFWASAWFLFLLALIALFPYFRLQPMGYLFSVVIFCSAQVLDTRARFSPDVLAPKNFALMFFFFNMVIAPTLHCVTGKVSCPIWGDFGEMLDRALVLYALAFICFATGYALLGNRNQAAEFRPSCWTPDPKIMRLMAMILILLGVWGFAAQYGSISALIQHYNVLDRRREAFTIGTWRYRFAMGVGATGLLILFVEHIRRKGVRPIAVCCVGFVLVLSLAPFLLSTGSRSSFAPHIFLFVGAYHRFVKHVRFLSLALILGVFLAFGFLWQTARHEPDLLHKTAGQIASKSIAGTDLIEWITGNLARVDVSAALIAYVDKGASLEYGISYLSGLTKLVSRSHVRQSLGRSGTFVLGDAVYGEGNGVLSSLACPMLGELYANFYVPGVVVGFLIVGILVALLQRWQKKTQNPYGQVLILFLAWRIYNMLGVAFDIWLLSSVVAALPYAAMTAVAAWARPRRGWGKRTVE